MLAITVKSYYLKWYLKQKKGKYVMYKLRANLKNGLLFITNSATIPDLQRIAVNLGSASFTISQHGQTVYEG